jgi:hypothetical protein
MAENTFDTELPKVSLDAIASLELISYERIAASYAE